MSNFNIDKARFDTKAIHAGYRKDSDFGALATPIYQTSTFTFNNADHAMKVFSGEISGYDYTRAGNPTVSVFEEKIAALENSEDAVATSSGMGAISSAIIGLLKSGDHIVCGDTVYGCTDVLMREILPSLGITTTFVNMGNVKDIEASIKENTKMIYFETPANPTMQITDIKAISDLKIKFNYIKIVVDNTFAPPPIQYPILLGADIVVHSVTKYINGHGDVIGGVVCGSKNDIALVRSRAMGKLTGTPMTPFCAYLVIRGMKTLGMRVRQHCNNAMIIAEYLESSPYIEKVYYPGLKSMGKDNIIAEKQMNGLYTGIISFVVKDGINGMSAFDAAKNLMDNLEIPAIAVSLGDPDSLIQHPASMTHIKVPKEAREAVGITDGMLRFSVGLEDVEDIKDDFKQAFARF